MTLQDDRSRQLWWSEVHVRAAQHVHLPVVLDVDQLLRSSAGGGRR